MTNDNVTSITKQTNAQRVTIDSVKKELDAWRATKTGRNDRIPDRLWEQIHELTQIESSPKLLTFLNITAAQFKKAMEEKHSQKKVEPLGGNVQPITFCQVQPETQKVNLMQSQVANQDPAPVDIPLTYKPAKTFTTTTSVVELYRKDGALMKIHLCTDRFEELLTAFFKGQDA